MSDKDDRIPSTYATEALQKWDTLSDNSKIGVCTRIRAEAFLEYPQADLAAFEEMRTRCRNLTFADRDKTPGD